MFDAWKFLTPVIVGKISHCFINVSYIILVENPDFTFPNFESYTILCTLYGPGQMPIRTMFPGFYVILGCPNTKVKSGFCCKSCISTENLSTSQKIKDHHFINFLHIAH
jgi:hypothetical protein